jgi:hypothetical protein
MRLAMLADEFDSWVDWRESCEQVRAAYRRWCECPACDRARAFSAYRSALGREQLAARRQDKRATARRPSVNSPEGSSS